MGCKKRRRTRSINLTFRAKHRWVAELDERAVLEPDLDVTVDREVADADHSQLKNKAIA